jgi:hypothetical protein
VFRHRRKNTRSDLHDPAGKVTLKRGRALLKSIRAKAIQAIKLTSTLQRGSLSGKVGSAARWLYSSLRSTKIIQMTFTL